MFNKVFIISFALAFSIAAVFLYAHVAKAQVVPDGLIAYWTFDDIDGDTVPDSVGGNHGTITEGDLKAVPGAVGMALEFDGTGYVDIGAEVGELGAADFSFAVWIKTSSIGVSILSKGNGGGWESHEKELYVADSATSEGPNTGPVEYVGWGCDWIRGSINVDDGEWHHIAVTWDMAAHEGHAYVDGEEGTHEVNFNGGGDNPGNTVRIGFSESAHSATNFVGLMDNLRIYDRAVTEDEIAQIMEEVGAAVSPASKLASAWGEIKVSR